MGVEHREFILTCDALLVGLGAVISHKMDDGTEKPICYVSRKVGAVEQMYAQVVHGPQLVLYSVSN